MEYFDTEKKWLLKYSVHLFAILFLFCREVNAVLKIAYVKCGISRDVC